MRGQKISRLALLWVMIWTEAFAGTVRTALVNNDSMAPIYLKLGHSTVLRFVEKPKKVVVGNQNYYGLEFIENDVAIQPLGAVSTNLFVYTEHHTYGFLLTPGDRYDDLVFIRWKYPALDGSQAKPVAPKEVRPNLVFKVGDQLKVAIERISGPSTFGLYIIDFTLENSRSTQLNVSSLELQVLTKGGRRLEGQKTVIESEQLASHGKSKARLILKLDAKDELVIEARLQGMIGKTAIGRKFL